MNVIRRQIPKAALALAVLLGTTSGARAQFFPGTGFGYSTFGYGFPGYGPGFVGYGFGYPAFGYGFGGYPGFGYGVGPVGYGYGGFGGPFLPGYGIGGYSGIINPYGVYAPGYLGTGLAGVGYPGIGGVNPYFSFGLSPLGVINTSIERSVLGRRLPNVPYSRGYQGTMSTPTQAPTPPPTLTPAAPTGERVGTGTFAPR